MNPRKLTKNSKYIYKSKIITYKNETINFYIFDTIKLDYTSVLNSVTEIYKSLKYVSNPV